MSVKKKLIWDYKVLRLAKNIPLDKLLETLYMEGLDTWQLVEVYDSALPYHRDYLFKKEVLVNV